MHEGRDWERGADEDRGDENRVWDQRTDGDRGQERRREIDEERGRGKQRGRERDNERAERHKGHAQDGRREEDAKAEPGSFSAGGDGEVKPEDRIPDRIDEWLEKLKKESGLDTSFDVQVRQMTFGHKRTGILFLSPFAKDTALTEILKRLSQLDPESFRHGSSALKTFFEFYLPAIQVTVTRSMSKLIEEVMIGNTAFYVDGESAALIIDAKQYPARTPDEPVLEKVVRGSKDGFTETLLTNVALIRRRLRDPHLRFEILKVGTRTQTDVAIGYVEDIADAKLVEALRDKIQAVNIDGIPLGDKQLEEMTVKTDWNPFPLVRYSERPDVVASHLMNGSVTVVVDTSPSVILLPTTFFDLVQHAEENRQNAFIGTYLRWVRFFGILSSIFLLPLWFLFAENPELRPHWLWFLGADKTGDLPLILQFLMVEIGVDLMRLAAVHTPSPLVTAMSLVSAILVGDIAVKTGLFINEVILYMAVAAIGMFATPSYELGLANRIVRLVLLLAAFAFQAPGLVVAATVIFIWLALTRSFNSPYLWPLIPFNAGAMLAILLRRPLPKNRYRPSINRPKQNRKQPFGHRGGEAGAGS
ncbi:spore germination protein [Cohnella fermenti]|uniref:Spore germination protein n=1 Tax=Cohnella fermenti TaxID=2565925 RepID=A0A4S4BTU7_9BACL|nr:spore germination protein [Cohnella fermenti]